MCILIAASAVTTVLEHAEITIAKGFKAAKLGEYKTFDYSPPPIYPIIIEIECYVSVCSSVVKPL